jgi:hypothetical protein
VTEQFTTKIILGGIVARRIGVSSEVLAAAFTTPALAALRRR